MPRTDEAEAFFYAVYSAVQEIPYGKVTSYGHIAKLVGTRMCYIQSYQIIDNLYWIINDVIAQRPRQVGVCLKHLSSDPASRFNNNNVPWQRVINSKGIISPRYVPRVPHQSDVQINSFIVPFCRVSS